MLLHMYMTVLDGTGILSQAQWRKQLIHQCSLGICHVIARKYEPALTLIEKGRVYCHYNLLKNCFFFLADQAHRRPILLLYYSL